MDRCNLSAVSLGSLAKGSDYTYVSGNVHLTVDYVFADKCHMNDPVLIVVYMRYASLFANNPTFLPRRIDWKQAERDGLIFKFNQLVGNHLAPLMKHTYGCVQDISRELVNVASLLIDAAQKPFQYLSCINHPYGMISLISVVCMK